MLNYKSLQFNEETKLLSLVDNAEYILINQVPRSTKGIYMIHDNHKRIIYIGISGDIKARMSGHKHKKHMCFLKIIPFKEYGRDVLKRYENFLIQKYKPALNIQNKGQKKVKNIWFKESVLEKISREISIEGGHVNTYIESILEKYFGTYFNETNWNRNASTNIVYRIVLGEPIETLKKKSLNFSAEIAALIDEMALKFNVTTSVFVSNIIEHYFKGEGLSISKDTDLVERVKKLEYRIDKLQDRIISLEDENAKLKELYNIKDTFFSTLNPLYSREEDRIR